ncbi:carboxylesterase/lipase family protein [Ramlibacter albus]|uniref:Carboxylic ester hydrolase n=1 Tax=Ramlibacter albus TaxID=2079448 RepID=A0A923S2N6_9BURK|nr:carboxylesterase family protein [Ramlibacter albus]MBC5765664.1 carboxylesterase family protein [Ramlibacter albus]
MAFAVVLAAGLQGCGGGSSNDSSSTPSPQAQATAPTAMAMLSSSDTALRRQTQYGPVLGARDSATGTLQWLGIPYAKPPVGDLRWRAPVEPDPWQDVLQARSFGASCSQAGRLFSPSADGNTFSLSVRDTIGKPVGQEDCLTLNIWRPEKAAGKLPVIVFIHGGSNVVGYSADPMYHGGTLASKTNAVVVTVNYRLGMFGWFDLAQLKTGDPANDSANFGTLDHIQALRFIQRNIASFGGDPSNVTVMGESAGAVNVWALLVSPLANGLMHKAVSMSGGLSVKTNGDSRDYATKLMRALLKADGKASDDLSADLYISSLTAAEVAAYMRSKTADEMIRVAVANKLPDAPAVLTDNYVIPWAPNSAIASGNYNRMPMLAGNNLEEGKLFGGLVGAYKPTDYDRFTMMYTFDPNAATGLTDADFIQPQFLPVEQPGTGWNDVAYALTTGVFTSLTQHSMNSLILQQPTQTWYYRFDWRNEPAPFRNVYGAVHALDLPFWFGNFGKNFFSFAFNDVNQPGRLQLSESMMATIGTFAATGRPENPKLGVLAWPNWPAGVVLDATNAEQRVNVLPVVLP